MLCDKWRQLPERMESEFQSVWGQGLKCMGTGTEEYGDRDSGQVGMESSVCNSNWPEFQCINNVPAQNEFLGTNTILVYVPEFYKANPRSAFTPIVPLSRFYSGHQ